MQSAAIQIATFLLAMNFASSLNVQRPSLDYATFRQVPVGHLQGEQHDAISPKKVGHFQHLKSVWVPGHISHHAYIPAHHVIVQPHALVVTRTLHTVELHKPYGGYGVGISVGGHGAGHGYQVSYVDAF